MAEPGAEDNGDEDSIAESVHTSSDARLSLSFAMDRNVSTSVAALPKALGFSFAIKSSTRRTRAVFLAMSGTSTLFCWRKVLSSVALSEKRLPSFHRAQIVERSTGADDDEEFEDSSMVDDEEADLRPIMS